MGLINLLTKMFRPLRDARASDEKAIFAHDSHRGDRPSMVLCSECLALMAPPRETLEDLATSMAAARVWR